MRVLIVAVVLALVATPAHAEKSLTTARILSGVGTGASAAITLAAFVAGDGAAGISKPLLLTGLGTAIITPSLGELYAGSYFTPGIAIRLGATALAIYAIYGQQEDVRCSSVEYKLCKQFKDEAFVTLGLAAIAFIGGAAYDIKELPDYVAKANGVSVSIIPTVLPTRGGEIAPGLATILHF